MSALRLRDSVHVTSSGRSSITATDGYVEITLEGAGLGPAIATRIERERDLAASLGDLEASVARDVGAAFFDAGLLRAPELDRDHVPRAIADGMLLRLLDTWVADSYAPAYWDEMSGGAINLLYGFAVENIHYTASVAAHIGATVAQSNDEAACEKLVSHLGEEWDHPRLFAEAATALAVGERPDDSTALGSTSALALLLRNAGKRHPFAYKAAVALLERTASRWEETQVFYDDLVETHEVPRGAVDPLVAHAEADAQFGHTNSLAELPLAQSYIRRELLGDAIEAARDFADLLLAWQLHIRARYSAFPRGSGAANAAQYARA